MKISGTTTTSSSNGSLLLVFLLLLLLLLGLITDVSGKKRTDFIDCNNPCNGGDVNYELTARIRVMSMILPDYHNNSNNNKNTNNLVNYTYKGRTYSQDGDDGIMGPTIYVAPGQSLWIKLRNELDSIDNTLQPKHVEVIDYWKNLQNPGETIKYQYYKKSVSDPKLMKVDYDNIPHNFDSTNLHVHGLDVQVHMFDPVNTKNPDAHHVTIHPGQCYCYKFDIPYHHPGGLYWYHPHLHGSTAIQIWGGMLGLIYVKGPLEQELANYGVYNKHEFVIWDPAFRTVEPTTTTTTTSKHHYHNLEVDYFLMGQTTLSKIHPFLVNGQYNPTFTTMVDEVLWLRCLCATIENENTFIIYKQGQENQSWDQVAIPFWIIASDGVTYSQPKQKKILVMAGGQRDEILIQFEQPGIYVISQQGIEGMQFFDMYGHPHNQILATIVVVEQEEENDNVGNRRRPTTSIADMRFTPGYKPEENIQSHDIVKTETIVFSMGANRDQAPFPQYYVNGKSFSPNRLDFHAHPGDAVEYILINANHNVHPFHIHVNRFQVKEMGSELSIEKYPVLKHVLEFDPFVWKDTVIIPPNGRARIWVQYKNYTGKTVFHCHFLAHEDTGMMSTLFIGPPDWVFRLEEYMPLFIGLVIGILVSGLVIVIVISVKKRREQLIYEPVVTVMNELKSKAQD